MESWQTIVDRQPTRLEDSRRLLGSRISEESRNGHRMLGRLLGWFTVRFET